MQNVAKGYTMFTSARLAYRRTPQVPTGPQAAALDGEYVPSPLVLAANDEIFFVTCSLPHSGQVTSLFKDTLRTNLSNG
jgi:hypothetical protein